MKYSEEVIWAKNEHKGVKIRSNLEMHVKQTKSFLYAVSPYYFFIHKIVLLDFVISITYIFIIHSNTE